MGVPALFRWLSKKYPKIISAVIEEKAQEFDNGDGTTTSLVVDATKPNPNGVEYDNLYLDMNGIVHPCSHPEDRPAPATEEEMMIAIFEYTDRVMKMVRPRKLLMIAVDGVAPRAKMNQQRSRRFRSAQEAAEKDKQAAEFHAQLRASGAIDENGDGDGEVAPKKTWDSNSITPGTPFMDLLAASLRYWVGYKSSTDPAWQKLKIVISDATVPGEGEHKIMNFIRSQRSSPTHDPNTRHVLYGLDADLIMLGIATHEPHFHVLREDVFANDTKPGHCRKCNQPGHMADECRGAPAPKPGEEAIVKPLKPFIWLHVGVLREYLAIELSVPDQGFHFELERALDDWVFMCFFVGNDFLPHLPSLDIREDGIDTLIAVWRDNMKVMGGYVTKDGHVDLQRAQVILEGVAKQENAIFRRRRETELRMEAKAKRRQEQQERRESGKRMRFSNGANDGQPSGFDESVIRRGARGGVVRGEAAPDMNALPTFAPGQAQTRSDPRYASNLTHQDIVSGTASIDQANADNRSAAAVLKQKLLSGKSMNSQKADVDALFANATTPANGADPSQPVLGKRTRDMVDEAADDAASSDPTTPGRNTPNKEIADPVGRGTSGALGGNSQDADSGMPEDTVKLWEDGYQERYYEQKFHVAPDDKDFRHKVARSYVEGLAWVLLYYFQGCPSWTWYYPYHYAPFAEDFVDIGQMTITFDKGTPFHPYEQLMGVMPALSNHTIPQVFHPLMTDEDSPIIEFYPTDFEVDLNGKKFAWQGVALLPWIDEKRLLDAMATKYPLLSEEEKKRNAFGNEVLVFSTQHPLYEDLVTNFYSKKAGAPKFKLDTHRSQGLAGKVSKNDNFVPNSGLIFPFQSGVQDDYTSLDENESMCVNYHMPALNGVHKSMLLPGVVFAEPVLDFQDVQMTRDKSNRTGRSHGGVQLSQNGDRSDGRRVNYAARPSNGGDYGHGGSSNGYASRAADVFAHLPPHLAQQAAAHGFAPPPGAGAMGYPAPPMPPMPPQQQQQQQQQRYGGHDQRNGAYDQRSGGYDSRTGWYNQRDSGYDQRNGGYGQRNGGYGGGQQQTYGRGYDQRSNGYGGSYGGGYQGGRGGHGGGGGGGGGGGQRRY